MLDNTYNSYGLRCTRLTDINGKHIKEDTLFLNIYDYWTHFHNPNKIYFWWNNELLSKLERNIRRKWKKHLPTPEILFEKIKADDVQFNPTNFLNITIVKNTLNYCFLEMKNSKKSLSKTQKDN